MRRLRKIKALKDGWSSWQYPIMRGYLMGCCDCGLVHEVEFDAVKIIRKHRDGTFTTDVLDNSKYRIRLRMKREVK